MQKVYFKVDNQRISGTLIFPKIFKPKNPAVLFIHGWMSNQEGYFPRAQALTNLGFICLTFDLRGHGKTGGKLENFSRQDHLKDVLAAYDFLILQKNVDKNKIGVVGASYGGYLGSILTSKRKVKWLVLRAPALYKDEDINIPTDKLIKEDIKSYRQSKIRPKDNLALKAISCFKRKLLIVQSENDEVVPQQTIKNYLKAKNPQADYASQVIKEADHPLTLKKWKKEFIDILKEWFKKKLK